MKCFATGPSVRPSVHCQSRQHDISETNEPILLQIGISGPWDNGMRRSIFGVRSAGQTSRSHEAKVRLGGLAEARPIGLSRFSSCV